MPRTFLGAQEERLVDLDDAAYLCRLVVSCAFEKPMAPAELGCQVDPAALGRLSQAHAAKLCNKLLKFRVFHQPTPSLESPPPEVRNIKSKQSLMFY